jgi:D-alanyl-D-alanine carboxypeptidase
VGRFVRGGTVGAVVEGCVSSWLEAQPFVSGIIVNVRSVDSDVCVAAGFARPDRTESMTPAHVFRIASNTKTFVAAATMRLVELGAFGLDDSIALLAPGDVLSVLSRRYDLAQITVRMLLQHTSGIASHDTGSPDGSSLYLDAIRASPHHQWTALEQITFAVEHFPPTHAPGGPMQYTDTGYVVLGQVLEHVADTTLASLVRLHCRLDDLGLASTWWERHEAAPSPTPPSARVQMNTEDWQAVDCSIDLFGGGGLISSVRDLTTWWRALFNGEILRRATLAQMLSPLAPSAESHGDAGLGLFRRSVAGRSWWTHSGYWGSIVLHDPVDKLTLTAFRNQSEVRTSALEPTYETIIAAAT